MLKCSAPFVDYRSSALQESFKKKRSQEEAEVAFHSVGQVKSRFLHLIEQGVLSPMRLTTVSILQSLWNLLSCRQVAGWVVTLLRRKPRLRAVTHFGVQARSPMPMNVERVPFEALKERRRVCFGGFRLPARSRFGEGRPSEACGGATGISPWGSTLHKKAFLILTDSHVP